VELTSLVDLEHYPIDRPDTLGFEAAVALAREGLDHGGCSVLRGFITPAALEAMASEAGTLRAQAHVVDRPWYPYPPYQRPTDGDWPGDHPRSWSQNRQNRFIAYDLMAAESALRALYEHPAMTGFVRAVLGRDELYPYGDPLGACALSVQEPGDQLPWHFDVTHFVVSLLLHEPESGGRFNYAPYLRSDEEENYDAVAALLAGDYAYVDLDMAPGDLQLFEGRHSMHRVTAPGPGCWRAIALLSYCDEPGVIGSEEVQRNIFGRVNREITRWQSEEAA